MPFTFAHPAIILPLTKLPGRFLSVTALVIGRMIPDFEYFFRMRVYSVHSHTMQGLFYFDLPVGLLIYLLYVFIIRMPLIIHLPQFLRTRLIGIHAEKSQTNGLFYWCVVISSLLIGASSHLLWDGFTHEGGYFVDSIAFLRNEVSIRSTFFPVFKLLQRGSTLIGIVVIVIAIMLLPVALHEFPSRSVMFWRNVAAAIIFPLLLKYIFASYATPGDYIVSVITGTCLGLTISSLQYTYVVQ